MKLQMRIFFFFFVALGLALAETDAESSLLGQEYFSDVSGQQVDMERRLVIGGKPSVEGAWPWQAAVLIPSRSQPGPYNCGASIIGKRLLLSAAHCFYDGEGNRIADCMFKFVVGTHNLDKTPKGFQQLSASRIILHERYNSAQLDFDIALVYLDKDIQYGPTVQPIRMTQREPRDGEKCIVTGFGLTHPTSAASKELMEVELPIVSRLQCYQQYSDFREINVTITKGMLCAGYPGSGKAPCKGDSGGPLACKAKGRWILSGIVSFGPSWCDDKRVPEVFANVANFRSWISTKTIL